MGGRDLVQLTSTDGYVRFLDPFWLLTPGNPPCEGPSQPYRNLNPRCMLMQTLNTKWIDMMFKIVHSVYQGR